MRSKLRHWTIFAAPVVTLLAGWLACFGDNAALDFRFVLLGDRTGEAQPGVYEQIWREASATSPAFVLNVGDSIQGGSDARAAAEWSQLWSILAPYKKLPIYFTPGNHDIWSTASRRAYERETRRPAHYSFDHGNAHFTVLDNSGTDSLDAGELDFLERDLQKNRARSPKFVVFHRPSWLVPVMFQNTSYPFHQLVKRYGVTHVISGHVHKFAHFEMDGITYLMMGSSGGHLRGNRFEDGWFFHYAVVDVAGGRVRMTIHETGAPFGKGRTFQAADWREGKGIATGVR